MISLKKSRCSQEDKQSQVIYQQDNNISTRLCKTKQLQTKFFNELNRLQKSAHRKNVLLDSKKSHIQTKKINQFSCKQDQNQFTSSVKSGRKKMSSSNHKKSNFKKKINSENDSDLLQECSIKLYTNKINQDLQYSEALTLQEICLQSQKFIPITYKQLRDGTIFKGVCQKGCMIKGQLIFKNGFIYQGQIFLGKFHGKGQLTLPQMQVIQADWIDGQPTNKVTIKYPKGQIYYGQIKNYKRHGKGNLFFTDGSKYQGEFQDGQLTGYGQYISQNSNKTAGYWYYGDFIGENEQVFENILFANSLANSLIKQQLPPSRNQSNKMKSRFTKIAKNKKLKGFSLEKEMEEKDS